MYSFGIVLWELLTFLPPVHTAPETTGSSCPATPDGHSQLQEGCDSSMHHGGSLSCAIGSLKQVEDLVVNRKVEPQTGTR